MARPAATDSSATRRRLVAAASEAFARQGSEATSLRDVARQAGVTIAVVHYHFGSKEGLRRACVEAARDGLRAEFGPFREILDGMRRRAEDVDRSREDASAMVEDAVRSAVRAVRQRRGPLRLLMRDLIQDEELDPAWSRDTLAPFLRDTAAALAPHLGIRARDLHLRLQSIVALVVRQALSTPRELAILCGLSESQGRRALDLHERHLVWLARKLLLEE